MKKQGIALVLENEQECNTATAPESVRLLAAVPNLSLNWDPGNSATFADDVPYPDDYNQLPKNRIGHCHVKDTIRKPDAKFFTIISSSLRFRLAAPRPGAYT